MVMSSQLYLARHHSLTPRYKLLERGLEGKGYLPPLDRVKKLTLLEGFADPSELCT